MDSPDPAPSVEEGIAFCERLFDWSVQQSEEASVALYSLGNPELLERATREIVVQLELVGELDDVLDVPALHCPGPLPRSVQRGQGRAFGYCRRDLHGMFTARCQFRPPIFIDVLLMPYRQLVPRGGPRRPAQACTGNAASDG